MIETRVWHTSFKKDSSSIFKDTMIKTVGTFLYYILEPFMIVIIINTL